MFEKDATIKFESDTTSLPEKVTPETIMSTKVFSQTENTVEEENSSASDLNDFIIVGGDTTSLPTSDKMHSNQNFTRYTIIQTNDTIYSTTISSSMELSSGNASHDSLEASELNFRKSTKHRLPQLLFDDTKPPALSHTRFENVETLFPTTSTEATTILSPKTSQIPRSNIEEDNDILDANLLRGGQNTKSSGSRAGQKRLRNFTFAPLTLNTTMTESSKDLTTPLTETDVTTTSNTLEEAPTSTYMSLINLSNPIHETSQTIPETSHDNTFNFTSLSMSSDDNQLTTKRFTTTTDLIPEKIQSDLVVTNTASTSSYQTVSTSFVGNINFKEEVKTSLESETRSADDTFITDNAIVVKEVTTLTHEEPKTLLESRPSSTEDIFVTNNEIMANEVTTVTNEELKISLESKNPFAEDLFVTDNEIEVNEVTTITSVTEIPENILQKPLVPHEDRIESEEQGKKN